MADLTIIVQAYASPSDEAKAADKDKQQPTIPDPPSGWEWCAIPLSKPVKSPSSYVDEMFFDTKSILYPVLSGHAPFFGMLHEGRIIASRTVEEWHLDIQHGMVSIETTWSAQGPSTLLTLIVQPVEMLSSIDSERPDREHVEDWIHALKKQNASHVPIIS